MPKQRDTGFIVQQVSSAHKYIRMPDELAARIEWGAVKNCKYALEH